MNKTTALRNILRKPYHSKTSDYRLHLAKHNGQLWATNTYWCVPAEWFAGLVLPNVVDLEVGTYDAKSGVKLHDGAPNLGHIWPTADLPVIEPVTMHSSPVVLARKPDDLRLYKATDDETAFNASYLAMFEDECTKVAGGEMRLRQESALKPAVIERSTNYTRAHGAAKTTWHAVGLLMSVRLS